MPCISSIKQTSYLQVRNSDMKQMLCTCISTWMTTHMVTPRNGVWVTNNSWVWHLCLASYKCTTIVLAMPVTVTSRKWSPNLQYCSMLHPATNRPVTSCWILVLCNKDMSAITSCKSKNGLIMYSAYSNMSTVEGSVRLWVQRTKAHKFWTWFGYCASTSRVVRDPFVVCTVTCTRESGSWGPWHPDIFEYSSQFWISTTAPVATATFYGVAAKNLRSET